jgi:hypothetical protein
MMVGIDEVLNAARVMRNINTVYVWVWSGLECVIGVFRPAIKHMD